jgi:hypothetical protein
MNEQSHGNGEISLDSEAAAFRWMLGYNLSLIIHFHNDFRALLSEKLRTQDVRSDPAQRYGH